MRAHLRQLAQQVGSFVGRHLLQDVGRVLFGHGLELMHGVHHLAVLARDFEGESRRLETLGHPLAWALTLPGVCRLHYHDTLASFGHFIELWESTEAMRGLLEMVEAAARDWDGRDPIRRIAA